MRVERITVTKTNRFGDTYTIEKDRFICENEMEKVTHKPLDPSILDVKTSQIMDSLDEYFDMLQNSR